MANTSLVLEQVIISVHDVSATNHRQRSAFGDHVDAPDFEVIVVANRCIDNAGDACSISVQRSGRFALSADGKASATYASDTHCRRLGGERFRPLSAAAAIVPRKV